MLLTEKETPASWIKILEKPEHIGIRKMAQRRANGSYRFCANGILVTKEVTDEFLNRCLNTDLISLQADISITK
jgi:hypothetical protein